VDDGMADGKRAAGVSEALVWRADSVEKEDLCRTRCLVVDLDTGTPRESWIPTGWPGDNQQQRQQDSEHARMNRGRIDRTKRRLAGSRFGIE
jgi:hypothetical protein